MTTAEFSKFAGILSAALSQCDLLGFEIAQLEFHWGISSLLSLSLFFPDFYDTCEDSNLVECAFDHTSLVESRWHLDSEVLASVR